MVLWMMLMACATEKHDLVLGCWERSEGTRIHCFKKDGSYRFASPKSGQFEGTWTRKGEKLKITVDPFPGDTYTTVISGETMVLSRSERPDENYTRMRDQPVF